MKTIAVHLATGFEETEAITIIDILRRAGLKVITVSVTGEKMVTGSHQIAVIADATFEEVDYEQVDLIVLPGGMPGSKNLNAHSGLKKQILSFHHQKKRLAAICAAPLVFGGLNVLNGIRATCYPGFESELLGAIIESKEVVVDQHFVTSRGVGTALGFSLKLVEILCGSEKSAQLAAAVLAN